MTVPVWMLVGFAVWTVLLLLATVGVYRWSRILTGRLPIRSFRADQVEGADWYIRAMRAHANCVENLPVFGAIVFAMIPDADRQTIVQQASRLELKMVVHAFHRAFLCAAAVAALAAYVAYRIPPKRLWPTDRKK